MPENDRAITPTWVHGCNGDPFECWAYCPLAIEGEPDAKEDVRLVRH